MSNTEPNLADILEAGNTESDDIDLDMVLNPPEPETSPVEGMEYTGNVELDSREEISETLRAFKERAKREETRRRLATDSEFWTCFVFQDREQKEAFLRALNLLQHGDKYLDGRVVAKKLGVELPESEIAYGREKVDPKLSELT